LIRTASLALCLSTVGCTGLTLSDETAVSLAPGVEEPRLRALACIIPPAQGDPAASSDQRSGVERLNCHRDLMGVAPAYLQSDLSAAAQAHADYIHATDEYGHSQSDPTHPLFTGVDAVERAAAQGIDVDPSFDALLEVVSFHSDGADSAVSVDDWIDSVYHRAPLALPELGGVGVGSAGVFDVMELIAPWEGGSGVDISTYPGDGQRGVPVSFDSDRESPDPAPERGVVGYPVTASFLVTTAGSGGNPYGIDVDLEATHLMGPDGEVPCAILQPSGDALLLRTVALLPHEPLAGGEVYTATVVATLPSGTVEQVWSFTTSR
jgi:uncharacterized protein YkwD